jgi:hypothetical protein
MIADITDLMLRRAERHPVGWWALLLHLSPDVAGAIAAHFGRLDLSFEDLSELHPFTDAQVLAASDALREASARQIWELGYTRKSVGMGEAAPSVRRYHRVTGRRLSRLGSANFSSGGGGFGARQASAYIPGWCMIEWPPTSWGIPQWVWDTQPKAEAKAVADAKAVSADAGTRFDLTKMITPGGVLVAPISGVGTGPTVSVFTSPSSGGVFGARSKPPEVLGMDLGSFNSIQWSKGLPDWGEMKMPVLNRIIPQSPPADPIAAYIRLVTIPYIPITGYEILAGGHISGFFEVLQSAIDARSQVEKRDTEADLMNRSWDYNRPAQDAQLAILDDSLDAIRDAIDHGTERDAYTAMQAIGTAQYQLVTLMPKEASDLTQDSTWVQIGKGVATAAVAMVGMVAGGAIAAPLILASTATGAVAQQKQEEAATKSWDQAVQAEVDAKKAEVAAAGAAQAAGAYGEAGVSGAAGTTGEPTAWYGEWYVIVPTAALGAFVLYKLIQRIRSPRKRRR